MKNIKETPKALVDPVAEGSTEQAVANAQVADDEKLSSQSSNNDEGNPSVESEASRRIEETPNLLSYEVFQYGDSIEDIDLGEIPYDMSDPESWEKIAQICKDKEVDIVCYLDKPALRIAAPSSIRPKAYSNIIAAERMAARGLAMFLPAAWG